MEININAPTNLIDFERLGWKSISCTKGEKGVSVETAHVKGSDIKAFRAISTYNISIDKMKNAIFDMDHFAEWMSGAVRASLIEKYDNDFQATYYENHAPWPVKNRDGVIIQKALRTNAKTIRICIRSNNTLIRKMKGLVRVEHLDGAWILQDIGDNRTKLTYQVHLEPNGSVPDWLINSMITDAPTNTLSNLHEIDYSIYPCNI